MSKETILAKTTVIRQEVQKHANKKERIADVLDDLNNSKADIDDIYSKPQVDAKISQVVSGIKGNAYQNNAPDLSTTELKTYRVIEPITSASAWGIDVTPDELKYNNVFFDVANGTIKKREQAIKTPYDDYLRTTADNPVKTREEFLESLKGSVNIANTFDSENDEDAVTAKDIANRYDELLSYLVTKNTIQFEKTENTLFDANGVNFTNQGWSLYEFSIVKDKKYKIRAWQNGNDPDYKNYGRIASFNNDVLREFLQPIGTNSPQDYYADFEFIAPYDSVVRIASHEFKSSQPEVNGLFEAYILSNDPILVTKEYLIENNDYNEPIYDNVIPVDLSRRGLINGTDTNNVIPSDNWVFSDYILLETNTLINYSGYGDSGRNLIIKYDLNKQNGVALLTGNAATPEKTVTSITTTEKAYFVFQSRSGTSSGAKSSISYNLSAPIIVGYKKLFLKAEDLKNQNLSGFQEVGNSFELEKPETLIKCNFFTTDTIPNTKLEGSANGYVIFSIGGLNFKKFAKIEVQGSSSASVEKKNFTISLYNDTQMQDKFNLSVDKSNYFNEWIFKANVFDASQVRNVTSARIWGKMVDSRNTYPLNEVNTPLIGAYGIDSTQTGAQGYISGFPMRFYINDVFYGIGDFTMGKKKENYNLVSSNDNHIQFSHGESNANFNLQSFDQSDKNAIEIRNPKVLNEGVYTKIGNLKTFFAMNQTDFNNNISTYLDKQNIIDYYLFMQFVMMHDGVAKNFMITTYNGVKWFFLPYDFDLNFGNTIGPGTASPTNNVLSFNPDVPASTRALWNKIYNCYEVDIKARYSFLRSSGVFTLKTVNSIINEQELLFNRKFYNMEFSRWPNLYQGSKNTQQILNFIRDRIIYLDSVYL